MTPFNTYIWYCHVPNECDKFPDNGPPIEDRLGDKVIHQEGHNLG